MRLAAALMLCCSQAAAQPFIEVGVGANLGGCIYAGGGTTLSSPARNTFLVHPGCSSSPLGLIAIGYQFTPELRIQLDHWSSLPDTRDRGVEILSIRYRYTFK